MAATFHDPGRDTGAGLLPSEERLALLSTLQELTLSALRLFDPAVPVSEFTLRMTERLRSCALLCVEVADPTRGRVEILGAGGLSQSSLRMPLPELPRLVSDGRVEWGALRFPYPEIVGEAGTRWIIPLRSSEPDAHPRALFIFFHDRPPFAVQLRGMTKRVATVLEVALDHRHLHARLMEKMALLKAQSDASEEGILILDPEMRVVSYNQRFLAMWGFDALPHGAQVTPFLHSAAELAVAPEAFLARVAYLNQHPDDEATDELSLRDGRTLERYAAPVRTPDGTLIGRGWYHRDVTERKRADEERARLLEHEREARATAEEAVRVRDEFLSAAAHELRTPLTPLSLRLATLERMAREGRVEVAPIEKARVALKKLNGLISDLLDLSRVQAGKLKLDLKPTELNDTVREIVGDFQAASPAHQVVFDEGAEVLVRADALRMEQVLTNLLENAAKYSPTGGEIRVGLASRDGEAVLSVSDEGIGIPKDQLPFVFDRFFRARNAPITQFGGLGLGLHISRTIVERHGGRIWAESEPGRGSTFYVALPLLSHQAEWDQDGSHLTH